MNHRFVKSNENLCVELVQMQHRFSQKLVLKDGAVQTLKAEAIVYGTQPVSMFYSLLMCFPLIVSIINFML